jgi:hypothetical protein
VEVVDAVAVHVVSITEVVDREVLAQWVMSLQILLQPMAHLLMQPPQYVKVVLPDG